VKFLSAMRPGEVVNAALTAVDGDRLVAQALP
jgi:hypothetical protein